MPDILTEKLYFLASVAVSSIDGVQAKTVPNAITASAFLDTMADFMHRMLNRIESASAVVASGGSAAALALAVPATQGNSSIHGRVQGIPFSLSGGGISATPSSAISTASNQIRKVGVALVLSSLPLSSSFDAAGGSIQFIYGSAMKTAALACSLATQAAFFNSVPMPRFSADQVPIGVLLIPNSFASGGGIANSHIEKDQRVWQGANLSLVMVNVPQP